MAGKTGKKYAKYFIEYEPWMQKAPIPVAMIEKIGVAVPPMKTFMWLDNKTAEGCHFYWAMWFTPEAKFPLGIGHPPHIHQDAELLFHIGTNPDDPTDLGADVELYMGEEMERYVINKTCVVYIPPHFIHCPWKPLVTRRPWIFIEVNQGPVHTEKGYHHLTPKELKEKYADEYKMMGQLFVDEGF